MITDAWLPERFATMVTRTALRRRALFELLEDFFPPAGAGMVTCDQEGRVLSCGRGVFELTGYSEREVMGKPLGDAFGFSNFENGSDPIPVVLEWGVRKLDQHVTLRHHSGRAKRVRVDLFPAYDEDGGLLASLAPEMNGHDGRESS